MIRIKKAEKEDLATVHNLAHEIWPSSYLAILGQAQLDYMLEQIYSLPSLEHQFQVLKHLFIIVLDDEIPAGFASYSQDANAAVYHLNKIYVLADRQGKSLGKTMLNFIIEETKKAGAVVLQLNVNRHNKARYFYERQGFEIIHEQDIDIGSGYFMNDYVMELKL